MKKRSVAAICLLISLILLSGCGKGENMSYSKVKITESDEHQTWEGFGCSGCWWSQYVGGWTKTDPATGLEVRDAIARLLYSKENGIGLNIYRYNLGAGSWEKYSGDFWDQYRQAECFETEPGVYDWTKDEEAVWFLKRVMDYAGEDLDVVFFCNSPLRRLTINGLTMMTPKGSKTNIREENYDAFTKYVFDVTEHFIEEGVPVKEISPINEPQWDWYNGNSELNVDSCGQEGCHYETAQMVEVLERFVKNIKERDALKNVTITGPESGEWGGKSKEYVKAIMDNETLRDYMKVIDNHSYWTNASQKDEFARFMKKNYPDVKLRTSEWVEMVSGYDYSMDSAFVMANVILEDMKILDVTAWTYWVGVAPGNYRDGLIYVRQNTKTYATTKRLYGYGNFTRFIREGYKRVDISSDYTDLYKMKSVAFKGTNDEGKDELVAVLVNHAEKGETGESKKFTLELEDYLKYDKYSVYITSENKDLECVKTGKFDEKTVIEIDPECIATIVLSK